MCQNSLDSKKSNDFAIPDATYSLNIDGKIEQDHHKLKLTGKYLRNMPDSTHKQIL